MNHSPGVSARRLTFGQSSSEAAHGAEPPNVSSFDTWDLCDDQRFPAWQKIYSPVVDIFPVENVSGFHGTQRTWDLDPMIFQTVEVDPLGFRTLPRRAGHHPPDHWVISLLTSGHEVVVHRNKAIPSVRGLPRLISLVEQFHGRVMTKGKLHILFIPRDTFREAAHLLDAASMTVLRPRLGGIFGDVMMNLERRLPLLKKSELPRLVETTKSLLLAAIAPESERSAEYRYALEHTLVERVKQFVQDNLKNPELSVEFIARHKGISRSRLYRLFEPEGGVMRYVISRRLKVVHGELQQSMPNKRINDIAQACGFSDPSEFSRVFKRQFGYSPSDARLRGLAGSARHVVQLSDESDFSRMLRRP